MPLHPLLAGRLKLPADRKFRASVKLADGSVYKTTGALGFTDVRVNTQTGTTEARAQFANPNGVLRAGEFVRRSLGDDPAAIASLDGEVYFPK